MDNTVTRQVIDAGWVDIIEPAAPVAGVPWFTVLLATLATIAVAVIAIKWLKQSPLLAFVKLRAIQRQVTNSRYGNYKETALQVLRILQSASPSTHQQIKPAAGMFYQELNRCLYSSDKISKDDVIRLIDLSRQWLKISSANSQAHKTPPTEAKI